MDKYWHSRLNSSMLRVAAAQKKIIDDSYTRRKFRTLQNFRTSPKFSNRVIVSEIFGWSENFDQSEIF